MSKRKILIVDDNTSYASRLISLMREEGIENPVSTAINYDEAVLKIAGEQPAFIILDMNMPGKSGLEVLHYIKEEGWQTVVTMVTNHANDSYRKICLEAGAKNFLDKSRDYHKIPALIKDLMKEETI